MQEATEKKYLFIFVILDAAKEEDQSKKNASGILSLKSAVKNEGQPGIKLVPYLKDFPFSYYCIIRDLHQLPSALGQILVQYFSIMSNAGGN
jgi:midasin